MANVVKLIGFHDAPQLYFLLRSGRFSIFQADTLPGNWIIPVGIQRGTSDTLRFEFRGTATFSGEDDVYLEDRLEANNIDLRQDTVYDFVSHQTQENERFFLHYKNTTGIHTSPALEKVKLYSEKGDLRIKGLEDFMGCELLTIYDMAGRTVLEQLIPSGITRIGLNLSPAYYIVRLTIGKSSVSKKLLFSK